MAINLKQLTLNVSPPFIDMGQSPQINMGYLTLLSYFRWFLLVGSVMSIIGIYDKNHMRMML